MSAIDLQKLYKTYQNIYEKSDEESFEIIEEIVEELIVECIKFGYTLDEAVSAVENATILYINEAKITYGIDTESPEQRSARAKMRLGRIKGASRKAAVKRSVNRVVDTVKGAKAMAGVAGSIAKDEATRAKRSVLHNIDKQKENIKSGVRSFIGRGLRRAAEKVSGAASRFGEEVTQYDPYDIILSHLLDEGYAETPEAAEVIMVNMSEEWKQSIIG